MSSKEAEAQKGKQGWITPTVIPPEEWGSFRYRGKTLEELLNMGPLKMTMSPCSTTSLNNKIVDLPMSRGA